MPACCHEISPDKMSLLTSKFAKPHIMNVYKRQVKTRKRNPVFITSQAYARWSAASLRFTSQSSKSGIRLFHNLVHTLAAKVVRICNLTQRHSLAAHLKNFRISARITRGPWLQRTPFPARKALEDLLFFRRKHVLLLALTDVADPGTDGNLLAINNFDMNGRDSGVTSALGELSKGCYVQVESGFVVHGCA